MWIWPLQFGIWGHKYCPVIIYANKEEPTTWEDYKSKEKITQLLPHDLIIDDDYVDSVALKREAGNRKE